MKKLLLLPYIFFTLTLSVYGQGGVSGSDLDEIKTTTNNARAILVSPLKLTKGDLGLNFGSIVLVTSTGGNVTIAPASGNNTRTFSSSDLTKVSETFGLGTSAEFEFTGEQGLVYSIGLPTSPITVKLLTGSTPTSSNDATENMQVSNFTYAIESNPSLTGSNLIIPASGKDGFYVGGTLTVSPSQKRGSYLGQYVVTMEYQ